MIPMWKRWWSYLSPVHLETVASDINDYLEVYLISNRLRLTTMDAIYSYDDRYYNFRSVFNEITLPDEGAEVLILGLGLGSIPFILEKNFKKKYRYSAVETDSSALYLFNKYQKGRFRSSVEIHQADAVNFLHLNSQKFDLICVDVFIGDTIPPHLKEKEFLSDLKNSLQSGGTVLWNMLYDTKDQEKEAEQFIKHRFREYFPDVKIHQILGNIILIG